MSKKKINKGGKKIYTFCSKPCKPRADPASSRFCVVFVLHFLDTYLYFTKRLRHGQSLLRIASNFLVQL